VTFLSSGAKLGGEERYLELLLESLGADWIEEVVFLEHGPFEARLREGGYETHVLPTSRHAIAIGRSAIRLRRRLRRRRPTVVHANGVKGALVAALATAGTVPFVWVKHDFSWDGPIARFVGSRARAVVAVTSAVAETFGPRTTRKVRVVHNGMPSLSIDRAAGRRRLAQALDGSEPEAVLSLVGRLDPAKGHRELLAVAPELIRAIPGLRIALVGTAYKPLLGYESELRAEVSSAGLDGAVAFLGHRDDARELIAGSDVVVIPTVVDARGMGREGFSYVALESMAAGTPLIGYRHGGLPEIVGDCARLVPAHDRAALRDAVLEVLGDADLRDRMRSCGHERAASSFTVERMVENMKDVYGQAAKGA
jgi:glycosyltransferase involved in cell wall biosynthesis